MVKFPQLDWKTWVTIALGSTSVMLLCAVLSQWKYASLGKQVSRNVMKFLTEHGAHVEGGVVSGGVVSVPLKINTAVNSTILQMLEAVATQMASGEGPAASAKDPMEPEYTGRRQSVAKEAPPSSRPKADRASEGQLVASASPRATGRAAAAAVSPPSSPPKDDCGFADPNRGKDHEGYNPTEFAPATKAKVSVEQMMADEEFQ
jgi:hypothetical protein